MQAGKPRHRAIPQKFVSAQGPLTGEIVENWVNPAQSTAGNGTWTEVYPLSAGESTSTQATQNEITTRITIRQRNDITPKCHILYQGKIFDIKGVLPDPDSGLEYLTLSCSKGVNDG